TGFALTGSASNWVSGIMPANVLYVAASATGTGIGIGSSWSNAMTSLSDALAFAQTYGGVDSILVAAGTYQPAAGSSFSMVNGVKMLGGYNNSTGVRNITANPSVLQGNGSSVIYNNNNGLTSATLLDGFTITGGNAASFGG